MRVAVLSDLHGNLVALQAALRICREWAADRIVCAGDVAMFGPRPNECISLLAEAGIATARGNTDREALEGTGIEPRAGGREREIWAINEWCRRQLTAESRRWLSTLPPTLSPAPGLLVVHASPASDTDLVPPESVPAQPFSPGVTVIAAGHLHRPFVCRGSQGRCWVNAGSAGRPADANPMGSLALLQRLHDRKWEAETRRFAFDMEAAVRDIQQAGMPHALRLAETQQKASWWP